MKGLVGVGLAIVIIVILYVAISGYVDCWSTSPAETIFGKLTDCGG